MLFTIIFLLNGRCFAECTVNKPNRQLNPIESPEGPATNPVVIFPWWDPSQGASLPNLSVTQSFPCYSFGGKWVCGKKDNNQKQSLNVEQTACSRSFSFFLLSEHHGNIHFDMQIPLPFVQCSTEGNIDFAERQSAFALIVKLKLYYSFFGFLCI